MPYSASDLNREVLKIIGARSAAGDKEIQRAWLVTAILHSHPIKRHNKKDPDEFSMVCRQLACSRSVDEALAMMKKADDGKLDPELEAELPFPSLPGYKYLRPYYPIVRSRSIVLVQIEEMSDDELRRKASSYRKSSEARATHADEIDRYLDERTRRRSAA